MFIFLFTVIFLFVFFIHFHIFFTIIIYHKNLTMLRPYQPLQMRRIIAVTKFLPLSQLLLNLIPNQTSRIQLLRMPIPNTPSPIHQLHRHNPRLLM
ncbi:hypothetical protein Hanom_Chr16g01452561 [Helianthus anomalus]